VDTYVIILVGLLGLAVGSFLNVVIHRVPRDTKLIFERSACPKCGNRLKWYHNIPVLSYLFLGGKCGFCSARISIRYPLVEILNAVFYIYCFYKFGLGWELIGFTFLASGLLVIFFIDLDFQIIPDSVTIPGMVIGLIVSLVPGGIGIIQSAIGLIVGGGTPFLVAILGDWLFKKESLGGGDIKMTAMLGAFLGWHKILLIFILSAVIGWVVAVLVMFFSAELRKTRMIPFGPFLAIAAILAITYGDPIIEYYIDNFLIAR